MRAKRRAAAIVLAALLAAAAACGAQGIALTVKLFPQNAGLVVALRSPLTIEVKLEREGSRLVKRFDVPTGRQPKSVAFTPDGRAC